jgi:hypothetical protein
MTEQLKYIVVFVGTGEDNSNVKGVRTITGFESEKEFNAWLAKTNNKDMVVAQGVEMDEAHELYDQTPVGSLLESAVRESVDPDGQMDTDRLEFELNNIALLMFFRALGEV